MESLSISDKYQINDFAGENLTQKLENVKKLVKENIRKEFKILNG